MKERIAKLKIECNSLLSRAMDMDAAVQFEMARSCSPFDDLLSWKWNCFSAHQELGEAQHRFAKYYLYGSPPVAQDLQDAYRWFRLADLNGYKTNVLKTRADATPGQEWVCCEYVSHLEILVGKMTPAQVAEAERLAAEWKPNPAECELETTGTTD
jgi:TPR repeat protein